MPEIVKPFVDAGAFVGTDAENQVVAVLAGDGTVQALTSWDTAAGDAHYYAPAGTNVGGGTRRHLFDGEVYANTGTRSVPVYSNVRAWASITGKPTTIAGYGITDAMTTGANVVTTFTITSAGLAVTGAAGSSRSISYQTAGVVRWVVGAGSGAETGSNAGSAYKVDAYSDAGAALGTALMIDRATTGNITVTRHVVPSSDNAFDNGVSGAAWRNGRFGGTVTATTFVGALTGNASSATTATTATSATSSTTATRLATPRSINTVPFDGSADITLPTGAAAAGTLTGTTLATNVVTSSITTLGTLTTLVLGGNLTTSSDNAFDIGGVSSARFRDFNLARNAAIGGTLTALGNTVVGTAATVALSVGSSTIPTVNTVSHLFVGHGGGFVGNTTEADLTFNAYYNTGWKRLGPTFDPIRIALGTVNGQTDFMVAGSGAADSAISWVSTWSITSAGHLVGATDNSWDIGQSGANRPRNVYVANTITALDLYATDNVFTSPTGGYWANGNGSFSVGWWNASGEIHFRTGGSDKAVLGTLGWLGVGGPTSPAYPLQVVYPNANSLIAYIVNSSATSPNGLVVQFTAASPNNGTQYLINAADSVANRFWVYSNGGVGNFSANNINLSDERVKRVLGDIDGREAADTFASLTGAWVEYQYLDQTHDDPNVGTIAQRLDAALPEKWRFIVNKGGWGAGDDLKLWSIHEADLNYLSHAALSNVIGRVAVIEDGTVALTSRLTAIDDEIALMRTRLAILESARAN
jgi:hypothetical protein